MAISPGTTLVDHIFPRKTSRGVALVRDVLLILAFSVLMALSARIAIYLPFNPLVPITFQTLVVLLAGAALGSKRGALAMLTYLAEGAVGLPVFAGGLGGFIFLFGATGGYLWAFPVAAFVTGWLCQRRLDRSFLTSAIAMLPGTVIIYAIGVTWLAFFLANIKHTTILATYSTAIVTGMLPFIVGDLIKIAIAAALLPTVWKTLRLERE